MNPWEQFMQQRRQSVSPQVQQFASRLQAFNDEDAQRRMKDAQMKAVKGVIRLRESAELATQPKPQPQPGLLQRAGTAIIDAPRRVATGIARALPGGTSDVGAVERASGQRVENIRLLSDALRNPNIPADRKERLKAVMADIVQEDGGVAETLARLQDETDKRKFVAALAETGLMLTPVGVGRAALAKGAGTLSKAARGAGVFGAEGAAFGVLDELQEDDPTLGGAAASAGIGALFGAGTGAVLPVIGTGLRKVRESYRAAPKAAESGKVNRGFLQRVDDAVRRGAERAIEPILASAPGARTKEFFGKLRVGLVRSEEPILNHLRAAERKGLLKTDTTRRIETLIRDVKTAEQQAEYYMRGNQNWTNVIQNLDNKGVGDVAKYIEARAEMDLIRRGVKPDAGRSEKFLETIGNAPEEFAARYDSLVRYYDDLRERLVGAGIISRRQADEWAASDPSYIHIQRELENASELRPSGRGGTASIRTTKAEQKRGGSVAETKDLLQVAVGRTQQLEREILRNKAATELIDALKVSGLADPARTAENVLTRLSLRQALTESRPIKQAYQKILKSDAKKVRKLQGEVNRLRARLQAEKLGVIKRDLRTADLDDDARAAINSINTKDVDEMYEGLLELKSTPYWSGIRRSIVARDKKLAKLFDEIDVFSENLAALNKQRQLEYQEILRKADKSIKNKPTISRRVDGVDEVYTTLPAIEAAAKSWGQVPMGALGRLLATPVRVLRAGLTGALNPAFAVKSLVRDSIESFTMSRNAVATHSPANVIGAVADAAGRGDLFREYLRTEGASTFTDVLRKPRNAARAIREQARLTKPAMKRRAEIITTPTEWFRRWENVSRVQEQMGRFQNFRGAYNDAIRRGASKEDALLEARWAARNNMVDFWQTGDWSKIANAMFPYFNPTVQGGMRIARAFREKPVTTSAKILAGVQIPTVLATMYNLSDPRRAEIYLDMPPHERENNWIFVLPGTEKVGGRWEVVKIPKPPGVGNFSRPVENMVASWYGEDPVSFGDFVRGVVGAGSPVDLSSTNAAVGSFVPQQLRPLVQDATNYDFFLGRNIVPEWLKDQEDEPYKQHFDSTSATARQLGKLLDISPLRIEAFIKSTLGTGGQGALQGVDTIATAAGAEGEVGGQSQVETLKRTFTSASGGERQRELTDALDTTISDRSEVSRRITELVRDNDLSSADRLAEDFNRRVDELEQQASGKLVKLSDKQKKLLNSLRFPLEGGYLSDSAVRSRREE